MLLSLFSTILPFIILPNLYLNSNCQGIHPGEVTHWYLSPSHLGELESVFNEAQHLCFWIVGLTGIARGNRQKHGKSMQTPLNQHVPISWVGCGKYHCFCCAVTEVFAVWVQLVWLCSIFLQRKRSEESHDFSHSIAAFQHQVTVVLDS